MIIHDVEQNTPEWHALRLGIPTASNFKRIITPLGKASTSAEKYAEDLLAEMMTGEHDDIQNKSGYMLRGTELQDSAAQLYAFKHSVELTKAGFVTDDARTMGCSPDMLILPKGGLEIKVLQPGNHVGQLLRRDLDDDHKPQVQGSLAVTDAEWWDVMGYHPKMQPVIIRTYRDEPYIRQFKQYLENFHDMMAAKKHQLIKIGCEFHD